MTRLNWDVLSERLYRSGVDHGVLYFAGKAVVWSGLTSVNEQSPTDSPEVQFYDGQKYVVQQTPIGFTAEVEALTYPAELDEYDSFGFSYRNQLDPGYEMHIVYNASFSPQDDQHQSLTDQSELAPFKWVITSIPTQIDSLRATAHIVVDSNNANSSALSALEDLLYGTKTTMPRLPTIPEIMTLWESLGSFLVVDNHDGTYTITGPDSWFNVSGTTIDITSPSIDILDPDRYQIRSW